MISPASTTLLTILLLTSLLLLLLLLHHSLLAAQCQYHVVENLALLHPGQSKKEPWSNISSCRVITFHQEQVIMADWVMDCVVNLDLGTGKVEAIGTECDHMEGQGGLLMDQMGGVMLELDGVDKIAMYSSEELYLCKYNI